MLPDLSALIALQQLDTAADAKRKRLAELPASEQAAGARVADAARAVEAAKAALADNQARRRALEKDVAAVDGRLSRFNDHRAAVKTNQEYTALLHEISGAKTEKDGLEDQILLLLEEADVLAAGIQAASAALVEATREADAVRASVTEERTSLEADVAVLMQDRTTQAAHVAPRNLATYEQLFKGRRGIAVAEMAGEICTACQMRLRPHMTQSIRRNDEIVQCESCQRILYFKQPVTA